MRIVNALRKRAKRILPKRKMPLSAISEIHDRYIKSGYGAIAADELDFVQNLIAKHRPRTFVEIGMASGMSTGFIASFMDDMLGGGRLLSLDHDDTFFGDTTKNNGFLIPEIYTGSRVNLGLMKFKIAPDIHEFDETFEMAFIDANHQHPWPTIDMMCLYPKMTGPKIMVHHDLDLFMKQDVMFGIGPKYLFDQFPDNKRIKSTANNGNIFAVDLNIAKHKFEEMLMDLFKLPWSLRHQLQPAYIDKVRAAIKRDYSDTLLEHFDRCAMLNNMNDRFRSGL